MFSRNFMNEIKWVILVFIISIVLVNLINSTNLSGVNSEMQKTLFGFNLLLEILVFSAFSTFVVFGIKGFFESYSRKYTNVIIFSTGIILALVIFILSYMMLY